MKDNRPPKPTRPPKPPFDTDDPDQWYYRVTPGPLGTYRIRLHCGAIRYAPGDGHGYWHALTIRGAFRKADRLLARKMRSIRRRNRTNELIRRVERAR